MTEFADGIGQLAEGFKPIWVEKDGYHTLVLANGDPQKAKAVFYGHTDMTQPDNGKYEFHHDSNGVMTGAALYDNKYTLELYRRVEANLAASGKLSDAPIAFVLEGCEEIIGVPGMGEVAKRKIINPDASWFIPDQGFHVDGTYYMSQAARAAGYLELQAKSESVHAGYPKRDIHPLNLLLQTLKTIDRKFGKFKPKYPVDPGYIPTATVTAAEVGSGMSKLDLNKQPAEAWANLDFRLTEDFPLDQFEAWLATNVKDERVRQEITKFMPGYVVDLEHRYITFLQEVVRAETGNGLKRFMARGSTSAAWLPKNAHGKTNFISTRPEGGMGEPDWMTLRGFEQFARITTRLAEKIIDDR